MKIATFNVNSIKARLPRVVEWLSETNPDVACLQELKCVDDNFPRADIEALGYKVETHGQKTYNGVAILSKFDMEVTQVGLMGDDFPDGGPGAQDKAGNPLPNQARYLEVKTNGIRVASIYLPNGNPRPGPKYDFKLRWMRRLIDRATQLLKTEEHLVLAGDYNVIPEDIDVFNPPGWVDDAACFPDTRDLYREFLNLGFTDSYRQLNPHGPAYTFWDYQRGAWPKDNGLRIDMLMLSPQAADTLKTCSIDRPTRGKEKASDHCPIWIELDT
jgi:exodeoxyribonuclease-3